MNTFNRLTAKALLIETITLLKFGQTLAPNYKIAKAEFCKVANVKASIKSKEFLLLIQSVYNDNGLSNEFDTTISKFKANQYL
jgi:hypothetical protein